MNIYVITLLIILLVFMIKNFVTYHQHVKITDAIFSYHRDLIKRGEYNIFRNPVDYIDEESYDSTLLRFWDWGYKHILMTVS